MLLNCHTYYSFRYGTLAPGQLMDILQAKGYRAFALTDINNTSACLDAIRTAPEKGIRLLAGVDFRNGIRQKYVAIAINNEGYEEINRHLSAHLHKGEDFPDIAPGFRHVYVVYPLRAYKGHALRDNEYIGVASAELKFLHLSPHYRLRKRMAIMETISFGSKKDFNAHRLLRAIDKNTLLSKLSSSDHAVYSGELPHAYELYSRFAAFPEMQANTAHILSAAGTVFDYGKLSNKNLKHYTGSAAGDMALLRSACMQGLAYRYPQPGKEVMARIEKELAVIEQMQFASYFLINHDIVNYARHKNYYYVGRGSGANSILAYLLRITDVDPIELDLYFERFINLYRSNAPDFDMDFSWTDRDDITAYIFKRFGNERTALLGAYSTFQHDAVIRGLGKVFGLPPDEIDGLQNLRQAADADEIGRMVLYYGDKLLGFPSHLSVHSSGIIISERPVYAYTATSMPPKAYPLTQFSMLEAEDIGLYKFDILSQRGLGKIKDAIALVKANKGIDVDIHDIKAFKADEAVKQLLRTGACIGCFYVESPAMRMLLTKLKADDYLRLVAASSIIRPGVARSGMMRAYIDRFRMPELREKVRRDLPLLYDILEETYGVMVYQEDVIKVAHYFAGLSLAEADYLRRGMSWKYKQRSEFTLVKNKFFTNCRQKGYAEKDINDIWLQIESFANYAFSKGHSASYAVESYQALYLKAYFPVEYMCATLNNGGGFYRKELYIHEARRQGAEFVYPCVNRSKVLCHVEGQTVYPGFFMVSGMEELTMSLLLEERDRNGAFKDLHDFMRRVPTGQEQLLLLIKAGAFSFTGKNRQQLMWEMHAFLKPLSKIKALPQLFESARKDWQLPALTVSETEDAYTEMEVFGFTYRDPFSLLKDKPELPVYAADLKSLIGHTVAMLVNLVTVKYASTVQKERMYFGTFTDSKGDWVDTVHFPPSAKQYPFSGKGVYEIRGKVTVEYDFVCIDVQYLKRIPMHERE